jgi:uncharacterized protein YcbK (DUF882 family)
MNKQLLNNLTMNETDVIASRRRFLTRMAYGSLLAIGGSGIAEAAVKHAIHGSTHSKKADVKPSKKADTKHTVASHTKSSSHETKNVKNSLHKRLELKTANAHHKLSKHEELALKHSSKDYGSHHSHRLHNDVNNRIALRHNSHPLLNRDDIDVDVDNEITEYASQRESLATRFHSNDIRNNFGFRGNGISNNNISHKSLALLNNTTGDSVNVTYFEKGQYLPDALEEINYLYRDHLTDEIHPVDTALLDQLHDLQSNLGIQRPIHVICGYRSAFTNAHLRRNSRGVARNSLHMEGRAVDIRISGIDSRTIRDAALSMARGGVGYYPGSNFVHLDTGDFRTW